MTHTLPPAILDQHICVMGKTGAGKTVVAKLAVEQILADNPKARVCIIDPIKSDYWGLTSSASGKRAGLPFDILGGPHGHVPLHASAGKVVGELVASGALPLSIIDMADFGPGDPQGFFIDFASSLFKNIKGVTHLVIDEAHEFAPKERVGFAKENMAVYWAKRIATASRSKGIRLIVATQASQQLHNRVIGACDTLIGLRMTSPADQEPILKWAKKNASKETYAAIDAELSRLKTGTGFLCSGEAKIAQVIQFPMIRTYDNSATPDSKSARRKVRTAPVDQQKLRTLIGAAVEKAEADDPRRLRATIAELQRKLAADKPEPPVVVSKAPTKAELEAAFKKGEHQGRTLLAVAIMALVQDLEDTTLGNTPKAIDRLTRSLTATMKEKPPARSVKISQKLPKPGNGVTSTFGYDTGPIISPVVATWDAPAGVVAEGVTKPQQKVLDALAWWMAIGHAVVSREQVAAVAGYSPTSGGYNNLVGQLKAADLVSLPSQGNISLTAAGGQKANAPSVSPTRSELHQRIYGVLSNPQKKVLSPVMAAYPNALSREEVAQGAGYEPTSGGFNNLVGQLRTLRFVDFPVRGQVRAADFLFVGH